jgi:hypothetical protein
MTALSDISMSRNSSLMAAPSTRAINAPSPAAGTASAKTGRASSSVRSVAMAHESRRRISERR